METNYKIRLWRIEILTLLVIIISSILRWNTCKWCRSTKEVYWLKTTYLRKLFYARKMYFSAFVQNLRNGKKPDPFSTWFYLNIQSRKVEIRHVSDSGVVVCNWIHKNFVWQMKIWISVFWIFILKYQI